MVPVHLRCMLQFWPFYGFVCTAASYAQQVLAIQWLRVTRKIRKTKHESIK